MNTPEMHEPQRPASRVDQPPRLHVHKTALTSTTFVNDDGVTTVVPAVGVWADLGPLRAAGLRVNTFEDGMFPVMMIVSSSFHEFPLTLDLLIAEVKDEPEPDGLNVSVGEPWLITVPTSWVGLVTALEATPLNAKMILVDGVPPVSPESTSLTVDHGGIVLIPTEGGVSATLRQAMAPQWTRPMGDQVTPDVVVDPISFLRNEFWSLSSGIAMGHEHALNKMFAFAEWLAVSAQASGPQVTLDGVGEVDVASVDAFAEIADRVALRSWHDYECRGEDETAKWPGPMAVLSERLEAPGPVFMDAVKAWDEPGVEFDDVARVFSVRDAVLSLAVAAARRAVVTAETERGCGVPDASTSTYVLGVWADADADVPSWAIRATADMLMHHDTSVLLDLLNCNPDNDGNPHGVLATSYLHMLTAALGSEGMMPAEVVASVRGNDVVPANVEDLAYVANTLTSKMFEVVEDSDSDVCPACAAVEHLVESAQDQARLLVAATALLPVLADVHAAERGESVGDEHWLMHRQEFLAGWLASASDIS